MAHETALESQDLVVHGDRSELRLEAGRIVVHKDATTQVTPTEVDFTVDQVRGATLEAPPRGGLGWLHVSVIGGSPPPPTGLAAAGDPYTLPVTSRGTSAARRLVRMVERHVQARGLPSESGEDVGGSSGVVLNPGRAPSPKNPYAEDAGPAGPQAAIEGVGPVEGGGPVDVGGSVEGGRVGGGGPVADGHDDLVGRLRELAELHEAGALTDAEFRQAKQLLLA